jgi:ApbE superfamily uncharacterized protein (UPF0280 family)
VGQPARCRQRRMTAQRQFLPDGRLHLNHGPIDLIIEAFGAEDEVRAAYEQAWARFPDVLPPLVAELSLLRQAIGPEPPALKGIVAQRMAAAVWPHRARFITPMAAVAGAVADEMLAALVAGRALRRAYVNDGGDIALHLAPGERFTAGIVGDLAAPAIDGTAEIPAESPVRGIATSGRGGRSFSLGIADAVTVLARNAAAADAAATMIANAVDIDNPSIERRPALSLDPDSDLGERLVTVAVGPLTPALVAAALDAGAREASVLAEAGLISAAMLQLRGAQRIVGRNGHSGSQISFDRGGNLPRGWRARGPAVAPRRGAGRNP